MLLKKIKVSRCLLYRPFKRKISSVSNLQEIYRTLLRSQTNEEDINIEWNLIRVPSLGEYTFHDETKINLTNNEDLDFEEIKWGKKKEGDNETRLNRYLGGRVALRRCLKALNIDLEGFSPILSDQYGAPLLPLLPSTKDTGTEVNIHGSISHKNSFALAMAVSSRTNYKVRVGCDIECMSSSTSKAAIALQMRILTPNERACLGNLYFDTINDNPMPLEEEIMLRFSLKESIFKAVHPYLLRQVDFDEVEVEPNSDGTANVSFQFRSQRHGQEQHTSVSTSDMNKHININSHNSMLNRTTIVDTGRGSQYEQKLCQNLISIAKWIQFKENENDSYWLTFVQIEETESER